MMQIEDLGATSSSPELVSAANYNKTAANTIGWDGQVGVWKFNGLLSVTPGGKIQSDRKVMGDQRSDELMFAFAVQTWQREHGLKADGKLGQETWKKMGGKVSQPVKLDPPPAGELEPPVPEQGFFDRALGFLKGLPQLYMSQSLPVRIAVPAVPLALGVAAVMLTRKSRRGLGDLGIGPIEVAHERKLRKAERRVWDAINDVDNSNLRVDKKGVLLRDLYDAKQLIANGRLALAETKWNEANRLAKRYGLPPLKKLVSLSPPGGRAANKRIAKARTRRELRRAGLGSFDGQQSRMKSCAPICKIAPEGYRSCMSGCLKK